MDAGRTQKSPLPLSSLSLLPLPAVPRLLVP